jgi:SAM-dependent MidA family methyltransferase
MARANAAYYASQNPFKDFCTAPHLTQVFGELLGAWSKIVWQMMGSPDKIILAEAGPGTGAMMADALRAWPAPSVHLIETSPRLRAEQATRIPNAIWHESLDTIPQGPLILLANEFLDALPVRQFIRRETGWMERYVENAAYIELPTTETLPDDPIGSVREINEPAAKFVQQLAARNAIALFIDYGPATDEPGESVQAIKEQKYADPLAEPGTADITAHVNFLALAKLTHTQGPIQQNHFLSRLGLLHRTQILAETHPHMAKNLNLAAWRLTAPEAMGSLFKVLALCPKGFPPLPGFDP